jgi:hypothetical protein
MIVDSDGNLYLFSSGTLDWNIRQGVFYSQWNGTAWNELVMIDNQSEEPHWLQLALAQGNQIYVVWEAREQIPRGAWYATAQINSKYIAPQVYPTLVEITPTEISTLQITPTQLNTIAPALPTITNYQEENYNQGSPLQPMLAGVAGTVCLIVIIVLGKNLRARDR